MKRLNQAMIVMATVMLITATGETQAQSRSRTKGKAGSVNRSAVTQARRSAGRNVRRTKQRPGNRLRANRVSRKNKNTTRSRDLIKPGNKGFRSRPIQLRPPKRPITGVKPSIRPITGVKPLIRPITGVKPPAGPQPNEGIQEMPRIRDLGETLKDFNNMNVGSAEAHDLEDLARVKSFASKCLGLPAPCGWWVDFCCWQWWDSCCYPWYWDGWTTCYWDYVFCPRQVVVVDGGQHVLEEVSYYLGISGSQIPNFGFGIQQVKADSPAEQSGLAAGDVIVTVNGESMTGEEVLVASMQQTDGDLDLEVVTQGSQDVRSVQVIARRVVISSL